jgi:hypothetical protein
MKMNDKTTKALKVFALSTISFLAIIVINLVRHKDEQSRSYKPNKVFSVTVSEDKWDESTMPKGRRSPKGVLYNPEK